MALTLGTKNKFESPSLVTPLPGIEHVPLWSKVESEVLIVLQQQTQDATDALGLLHKILDYRRIKETYTALPELGSRDISDDAEGHLIDSGYEWRKKTSDISRSVATSLPSQQLGDLAMGSGYFYTTEHSLYEDDATGVHAYTDLITQAEFKSGFTIASEERWHNFLFRITLLGSE